MARGSAEAIAAVIADVRSGRVRPPVTAWHRSSAQNRRAGEAMFDAAKGLFVDPVVVDATGIYEALVADERPVYIYEDHPCVAPPWEEAAICYVNEHGNVIVMHLNVVTDELTEVPWDVAPVGETFEGCGSTVRGGEAVACGSEGPRWPATHTIDNARLRWRVDTMVWIGGRRATGPYPTTGPVHLWQYAIYADGEPADLHWMHLVPEYPLKHWDMAQLVLLGSLNFMNCVNVDLVEPRRPRAEARRLARVGVNVHTINVRPPGRGVRSAGGTGDGAGLGVPLTPVRGHYSHFGNCCPGRHDPRGLLFGKLEGRFYIRQHARGDAALGEFRPDYRLVPKAQ